jgi:regulatory protein
LGAPSSRGSDPGSRGSGWRIDRPSDPAELAREICLEQLAIRPRTRAELAAALRRRGIAADVAAEVLGRYADVGIVDDRAFARAWVTSRHHGRGLARRALAGELRRKGVGSTDVDEALGELDDDTETTTARAMVERRLRAERGLTQRPDVVFRRLVGMLARKGYPPGIAIRVVKEALAARSESAEYADLIDVDAFVDADATAEADPDAS